MKTWVVAVVVVAVVVIAGAAVLLYPPLHASETSTSTTRTTSTSSGVSTSSSNGLQLRLALNSTGLEPGSSLEVTVSEFNTEAVADNVTKASLWPVQGLAASACQGEGFSPYPFGIAVYQGTYSPANLTGATPLRIFPVVPCPLYVRLITGYLFQPMNDSAVILPGSGTPTPMQANVTVSGSYSVATLKALAPGVYTVAAGDEWGALETVQFTVYR